MPDPPRILIVDDDRDILTAARLQLKRHFDNVVTSHEPQCIPELMADGPLGEGRDAWRE